MEKNQERTKKELSKGGFKFHAVSLFRILFRFFRYILGVFFFSTNLSIKAKSSSTLFLIILWEVLFSNILAFASDNGRWYM
jgi:hypothetical protein